MKEFINKKFTIEGVFFFDEEGDPIRGPDYRVPYLFQESESESEIQKGVLEREDAKISEKILSYPEHFLYKTVSVEVEGRNLFEDGSSYVFFQAFSSRADPNLAIKIEPEEYNPAIIFGF